jgi:hypothetical protein
MGIAQPGAVGVEKERDGQGCVVVKGREECEDYGVEGEYSAGKRCIELSGVVVVVVVVCRSHPGLQREAVTAAHVMSWSSQPRNGIKSSSVFDPAAAVQSLRLRLETRGDAPRPRRN